MRRTGEATRAAIKEAALTHFCRNGYERTSLVNIAAELGITRSAVLFHFRSKGDLLRELAAPMEEALDRILDRDRGPVPLPVNARKELLTELLDCYIEHRQMVVLLTRDLSSHAPIDINPRSALRAHRLFHLLAGPQPSEGDRLAVRMLAGAVLNPLADLDLDVEKPEIRLTLLQTALFFSRQFDRPDDEAWQQRPPAW